MWSLARVCFLKYIPLVIATLVTITDLRHEEPGLSDGKSRIKSDQFLLRVLQLSHVHVVIILVFL